MMKNQKETESCVIERKALNLALGQWIQIPASPMFSLLFSYSHFPHSHVCSKILFVTCAWSHYNVGASCKQEKVVWPHRTCSVVEETTRNDQIRTKMTDDLGVKYIVLGNGQYEG
jgi:hypothetical protein